MTYAAPESLNNHLTIYVVTVNTVITCHISWIQIWLTTTSRWFKYITRIRMCHTTNSTFLQIRFID